MNHTIHAVRIGFRIRRSLAIAEFGEGFKTQSRWASKEGNMPRLVLISIFVAFASVSFSVSSKEIYLSCTLMAAKQQSTKYSFAFDQDKDTLLWVEGSNDWKVIRNTSAQLWASHAMKFRDFQYETTDFRLNRITGSAEITYLHAPSAEDVASCKKSKGFGCEDPLVLTEHSEAGNCVVVDRVVK